MLALAAGISLSKIKLFSQKSNIFFFKFEIFLFQIVFIVQQERPSISASLQYSFILISRKKKIKKNLI